MTVINSWHFPRAPTRGRHSRTAGPITVDCRFMSPHVNCNNFGDPLIFQTCQLLQKNHSRYQPILIFILFNPFLTRLSLHRRQYLPQNSMQSLELVFSVDTCFPSQHGCGTVSKQANTKAAPIHHEDRCSYLLLEGMEVRGDIRICPDSTTTARYKMRVAQERGSGSCCSLSFSLRGGPIYRGQKGSQTLALFLCQLETPTWLPCNKPVSWWNTEILCIIQNTESNTPTPLSLSD